MSAEEIGVKVLGQVCYPKPRGGLAVIVIESDGKVVRYLAIDSHLVIRQAILSVFNSMFERTKEAYEPTAKILLEYAKALGADANAADALGYLITFNPGDLNMATAATATKPATRPPARPAAKPAAEATVKKGAKATPEKTTKAATPKVEKVAKAPKEPKEKRPSVSSRICELIMGGKLTDEQIFATVQKEFGLDDSKKSYVSWNRSNLTKLGKNPPAAVGVTPKKEIKEAKALAKIDALDPAKKGAKAPAKPAAKPPVVKRGKAA